MYNHDHDYRHLRPQQIYVKNIIAENTSEGAGVSLLPEATYQVVD